MQQWNLSEAKNKFSEVINTVLLEGPQCITRRKERFVIMTQEEYEEITGPKKPSFIEFLLSSGPVLEGIEIPRERSSDTHRDINFDDPDYDTP